MAAKREIAKWKIDSPVEGWLGRRADGSDFWKRAYVLYYRMRDPGYYRAGLSMIEECFAKFGKAALSERERSMLARDMVYSLHRFGFMFDEYFWYGFEHLNARGRKEFVPDKVRYKIYDDLNSLASYNLFLDKWKTYQEFKPFFGREAFLISGGGSDKSAFLDFCERHPRFLVKPIDGNCGRGIAFYRVETVEDAEHAYSDAVSRGRAIVEEAIVQVDEMAAFHPSSVNTVRVPTLVKDGEVHIFGPFFRMGRGESIVDNAGSGGVFANVDSDTGICFTMGVDEVGASYLRHPDSGLTIPGFQIPQWDEALSLAKKLALKVEGARYVGWDLALTERGWVVVEGNSRAQFVMQIVDKRGRMREFLDLAYGVGSERFQMWFGPEGRLE